jgi:hypothetical protein
MPCSRIQRRRARATSARSCSAETATSTNMVRDVVMMDSLPVHRVAAVREIIEAAGAKLRYLPKYSPDLNPIAWQHRLQWCDTSENFRFSVKST